MSNVKVEHECHKCNEWITTEHTDPEEIDDHITIVTGYGDKSLRTVKEGELKLARRIQIKYFHLSCAADNLIKKYEHAATEKLKGHLLCRAIYEI